MASFYQGKYVVEMSLDQHNLAKIYELNTNTIYMDISSPEFHSKALLLE